MKSAKVFLLFMLVLYAILFALDWAKATAFLQQHHAVLIQIRTISLVAGGVAVMKLTLQKAPFQLFSILYLFLWIVYFVLKYLITPIIPFVVQMPLPATIDTTKLYVKYTQLFTPFPFLIFWFIKSVFLFNQQTPDRQLRS